MGLGRGTALVVLMAPVAIFGREEVGARTLQLSSRFHSILTGQSRLGHDAALGNERVWSHGAGERTDCGIWRRVFWRGVRNWMGCPLRHIRTVEGFFDRLVFSLDRS